MTTFDDILPRIGEVLCAHRTDLAALGLIVINRDLNGRVRLIVKESVRNDPAACETVNDLAQALAERLGHHAWPAQQAVLYEDDPEQIGSSTPSFALEGFDAVRVIDRLATESHWTAIAPKTQGVSRVVFFSIKGGVGRSTALAASAWALAQAGKRVLVLDLDLESPGLSTALLPAKRQPTYGITDWLVEDLVDNADEVFDAMVAASDLSHDGEIYVVPAHGRDAGEYVAKLGRVWMPKIDASGLQQSWSQRLARLVNALEARWQPDVILIDSRAGIDEVASSCVTDLGAGLVLLFAIDGDQTWSGYRILFQHWHRAGVVYDIRERLQMVGAMIPELEAAEYFAGLRERAVDLFTEELYDEIPPGEVVGERWNFDEADDSAPHYPWAVRWHRGFAALRSLHSRMETVDAAEMASIFGPLIDNLQRATESQGASDD